MKIKTENRQACVNVTPRPYIYTGMLGTVIKITIKDHCPCDDNHKKLRLSINLITCLSLDIQDKYSNAVVQATHFMGLLYFYTPGNFKSMTVL